MAEPVLGLVFIAAVAFVTAAVLTPLVARYAVARGWLDQPDDRRKTHATPVPTVGGVAVFAGFVVALSQVGNFGDTAKLPLNGLVAAWVPIAVAALGVMIVGLVDDLRGVSPRTKLAVQVAAAIFLYYNGFRIESLSNPFGSPFVLGMWALPVTVLWLVGMSNAFNLIDGLDGLAAGLAFVSTTGLLVAAALNGRVETVAVAVALAGALLGFLPYNFNPARVFLGDCGALPVGLVLAAIAVHSSVKASAAIAVAVPLLALALPILDVGLAVVRRFVRRRPVFEGDHHHIHHRLIEMGLTPRRAVVTLYGVAVLFVALALVIAMGPRQALWAVAAIVLLVVGAGVRALGYWEVTEVQKTFLNRLTAGLRPSGDAALRGVEHDLFRGQDLKEAWTRLCATAWSIGLEELRLVPKPAYRNQLPELEGHVPARRSSDGSATLGRATWSVDLCAMGRTVATLEASRPLEKLVFDPLRLVAIVEELVERHLRAAAATGSETTVVARTAREGAVFVATPSGLRSRVRIAGQ